MIEQEWHVPETEIYEGLVDRVIFSAKDGLFCVFKLLVHDQPQGIVVSGNVSTPTPGEDVRVHGIWWKHPRFGEQLKASLVERIIPTNTQGIIRYLSSGLFKGIGKTIATRIVDTFGTETLDIMDRDPRRLLSVKGIGPQTWASIMESYNSTVHLHELVLHLEAAGVSQRFAEILQKTYGDKVMTILTQSPYRLVHEVLGMGFLAVDKLARYAGVSTSAEARIEAGLEHVLWDATHEGHTCMPFDKALSRLSVLLNLHQEVVSTIVLDLVDQRIFPIERVDDDIYVYHPQLYRAEKETARHIKRLLEYAHPLQAPSEYLIQAVEGRLHIPFSETQRQAIQDSMSDGVVVITGGPGTGKTTLVRGIIECARQENLKVLLAAPTGRASKRLAEAAGQEASTLHKLLEAGIEGGRTVFQRNAFNLLMGDLIIVDEASMIDIQLMFHFLEAVKSGARVILVGDVDQLPPVGPGNALRDIIDSGVVPTICLKTVFRQDAGNDIALEAQAIREGHPPKWNPTGDLVLFEKTEEAGLEKILQLCKEWNYADDEQKFHMQILSPMYQGLCGVDHLNQKIQEMVQGEKATSGKSFWPGDKVMQNRNNYEKGIYNGDIGLVFACTKDAVHVDYRTKQVVYEGDEKNEIQLAYAMTVHKSQGSEYERVVIALMPEQRIMLQRNLLYTAITRARKNACIVGTQSAVERAVKTHHIAGRCGLLVNRLKE